MWIPFELGQTVYVIVDSGYDKSKTIHDGYDHIWRAYTYRGYITQYII